MSLPERKHHRLKNYDYSQNGAYFITICSFQKLHIFGEISDGTMHYSEFGKIVCEEIEETNNLRSRHGITITNWIVMPNHVHLLIEISHDTLFDTNPYPQYEYFAKPTKQSIATIIRSFKSSATKKIHSLQEAEFSQTSGGHGTPCPYIIWQKGYYDNIIKNEAMYEKVWNYIDTNPVSWHDDCYNEP